jgi:hypothetical protein
MSRESKFNLAGDHPRAALDKGEVPQKGFIISGNVAHAGGGVISVHAFSGLQLDRKGEGGVYADLTGEQEMQIHVSPTRRDNPSSAYQEQKLAGGMFAYVPKEPVGAGEAGLFISFGQDYDSRNGFNRTRITREAIRAQENVSSLLNAAGIEPTAARSIAQTVRRKLSS